MDVVCIAAKNIISMKIEITGTEYPLKLCERTVNDSPCNTVTRKEHEICTNCQAEIAKIKLLEWEAEDKSREYYQLRKYFKKYKDA